MRDYNLFVVTNPVAAIHASLLAKKLGGSKGNILVLDKGKRKKSFADEIKDAASGVAWNQVIDLTVHMSEAEDLKPSFRKRITRKLKHLPVIKYFYNQLLKKYVSRDEQLLVEEIKTVIKDVDFSRSSHTLFLLTQTRVNSALKTVFNLSPYYYFEHGLPDYLFSLKDKDPRSNGLYCMFNDSFSSYLNKRGIKFPVLPFVGTLEYETYVQALYKNDSRIPELNKQVRSGSVFVIMQPLERYQLNPSFWHTYIETILSNEKGNSPFLVIKPHPLQSAETVKNLVTWLNNKSIQHIILDSTVHATISCEVLLIMMKEKMVSVYSPFSYSIYFLSKLYNGSGIKFYHSYESMGQWFRNSPLQFRNQFHEHDEIIKECFSVHCDHLALPV